MLEKYSFSEMTVEERTRTVELVRRFGGIATDAVLDPVTYVFRKEGIEGFVGYRITKKALVVFGDPICALKDQVSLAEAFYEFAAKYKKEVIYVMASHLFAHGAVKKIGGSLVELAREMIFDPACDPKQESGTLGSLVRRKVKKAEAAGVKIKEYTERTVELDRAIEEVGTLWLQGRKGPQVHISNIYLFENCLGKRWFYAEEGDTIVGIVLLNELKEHKGYLINHLMVTPEAPNGTSEYLITAVLEVLAKEGCRFATVGAVPNAELGEIVGLNRFCRWCAHNGLRLIRKIAPIEGLYTFWKKFHPQSQPGYIVFSRNKIGLIEVVSLKNAFAARAGREKKWTKSS